LSSSGDVWDWAGQYRLTERNIGIDPHRIPNEMAMLFDDVRYWVAHETYPPDEIAIRLHHRLVAIHPFPNGNGRHARLMADLLIERLGGKPFTWGGGGLHDMGELRASYIKALRAADNHEIEPLLEFARF
jgi:Fic-DOC domain mobile mystery protein B